MTSLFSHLEIKEMALSLKRIKLLTCGFLCSSRFLRNINISKSWKWLNFPFKVVYLWSPGGHIFHFDTFLCEICTHLKGETGGGGGGGFNARREMQWRQIITRCATDVKSTEATFLPFFTLLDGMASQIFYTFVLKSDVSWEAIPCKRVKTLASPFEWNLMSVAYLVIIWRHWPYIAALIWRVD